ncbi:hypothetical protein HAX54_020888 [Datura stramonium]|uniref:Uncharacterized protein n=1 Tax=Datura stramonium TaxID=4076 RepID=A0ABS8UU72_DATST|nr:hypothetical protein [Datura stramonium]
MGCEKVGLASVWGGVTCRPCTTQIGMMHRLDTVSTGTMRRRHAAGKATMRRGCLGKDEEGDGGAAATAEYGLPFERTF